MIAFSNEPAGQDIARLEIRPNHLDNAAPAT
jgi:hypothetical protein